MPSGNTMAKAYLTKKGLEHHEFVIFHHKTSRRAAQVLPALPGYLFVRSDASPTQLGALCRQLPGITRLLANSDGVPIPLLDKDFALLRETVDQLQGRKELFPPLSKGALVEVLKGPLAHKTGVCVRTSGDIVHLMVELMGRKIPLKTRRAHVQQVNKPDEAVSERPAYG